MEEISVKEKFEKQIQEIWNNLEYEDIHLRNFGYALQDNILKNALMFIGLNPSRPNDTEEYFFYKNPQNGENLHPYFRKFPEISEKVDLEWTHIDLIFVRQTGQRMIGDMLREEVKRKFLQEQMMISKQIIEEVTPKVIVVNNTLARKFLGKEKWMNKNGETVDEWMNYAFEFDETIGTYRIKNNNKLNNIPVFFTSMLTGQRALDKGSFERLIWHIKYVIEKDKKST